MPPPTPKKPHQYSSILFHIISCALAEMPCEPRPWIAPANKKAAKTGHSPYCQPFGSRTFWFRRGVSFCHTFIYTWTLLFFFSFVFTSPRLLPPLTVASLCCSNLLSAPMSPSCKDRRDIAGVGDSGWLPHARSVDTPLLLASCTRPSRLLIWLITHADLDAGYPPLKCYSPNVPKL